MSETPDEPNNYGVEYSGSAYGDPRDPVPLSETVPEAFEEILRRAGNVDLLAARQAVILLENAVTAGNASLAQLQEAKTQLEEEEARIRKIAPPEE